jgi:hypothetical protein
MVYVQVIRHGILERERERERERRKKEEEQRTYSKQKYKQKLTERKRDFYNGKNNLFASLS